MEFKFPNLHLLSQISGFGDSLKCFHLTKSLNFMSHWLYMHPPMNNDKSPHAWPKTLIYAIFPRRNKPPCWRGTQHSNLSPALLGLRDNKGHPINRRWHLAPDVCICFITVNGPLLLRRGFRGLKAILKIIIVEKHYWCFELFPLKFWSWMSPINPSVNLLWQDQKVMEP